MKYRRSRRFDRAFEKLDSRLQDETLEALALFEKDPTHPSLNYEPVHGRAGVWSCRVTRGVRFTLHYERDPATGERVCVFRVVGQHDVYRRP